MDGWMDRYMVEGERERSYMHKKLLYHEDFPRVKKSLPHSQWCAHGMQVRNSTAIVLCDVFDCVTQLRRTWRMMEDSSGP